MLKYVLITPLFAEKKKKKIYVCTRCFYKLQRVQIVLASSVQIVFIIPVQIIFVSPVQIIFTSHAKILFVSPVQSYFLDYFKPLL